MTNNNELDIETKKGSFANDVIKVFSKGDDVGAWITSQDFIVGFSIGLDKFNEKSIPVISIHDNKNTSAHSICLYLAADGSPMLQASLGKTSETINLLDMISFIKTIMPKKEENNGL